MGSYSYKGIASDGSRSSGSVSAESKQDVINMLRSQGIYPVEVKDDDISKMKKKLSLFQKKVTSKELSLMCRQFHTIISAGISIVECIDILRNQTMNSSLKNALEGVFEDVQKGINLSRSFKKFPKVFPELLTNMVEAGETTGQLDVIMYKMSELYEKEHKVTMKVKGALVYPKILIVVSIIVVGVLLSVVLPGFVKMFEGFGVQLPLPTIILLKVGNFIKKFWWIIAIVLLVSFAIFQRMLHTAEGKLKYDSLKLKLPVLGRVNRQVATTRFARNLSTMLNSGVTIIEAMEMISKIIGNEAVSKKIDMSMEKIKKGEGIAYPLWETKLFPPMLISMIRIGEETGSLNYLLETTANFYDDEIDYAIETMISLVNPAVILFMAVVVGGVIMSVALPMFEMYQHMGF